MDSVILTIEVKKNTLPASEKKIAEYILMNKTEVIHQTITDISKYTGVSSSAVTRLCKSLGIKNFREFKVLLAKDVFINDEDLEEISKPDKELKLIDTLDKNIINSIRMLGKILSPEILLEAIAKINLAKYIHGFGDGLSNSIAIDFSNKMLQLGFLSGACVSIQEQVMFANNMDENNLGMIISHSGCSKSMVEICKILKKNNVPIISITGNEDSPIAKMSDIKLLAPLTEPLYRQGAGSSRITELVIIDTLYAFLIKQNYEYFVNKLQETAQVRKRVNP